MSCDFDHKYIIKRGLGFCYMETCVTRESVWNIKCSDTLGFRYKQGLQPWHIVAVYRSPERVIGLLWFLLTVQIVRIPSRSRRSTHCIIHRFDIVIRWPFYTSTHLLSSPVHVTRCVATRVGCDHVWAASVALWGWNHWTGSLCKWLIDTVQTAKN
jgi:hypothetical protein